MAVNRERGQAILNGVTSGRGRGSRVWFRPLRWWLVVPLLFLSGPRSGSADLDIQAKNGQLTLRVRAVPLVDVLERLSHQTGLKVVYEGRRPSQLITANMEGLSETEALSRLLEGLDVNYAFQTDASGRRVELLIISGSSGSGPSTASSRAPSPARAVTGRDAEPPEPEAPPSLGEGQGDPLESADADPALLPGVYVEPSDPFSESGEPAPPSFPSEASYPAPLPFFPPYASYPPGGQPPFD